MLGTVLWFNERLGFGVIKAGVLGNEVFVHYSNIIGSGFKTLKPGQQVELEIYELEKGFQAENVKVI